MVPVFLLQTTKVQIQTSAAMANVQRKKMMQKLASLRYVQTGDSRQRYFFYLFSFPSYIFSELV